MIDDSDNEFGDVGGSAFPTERARRESASYHPRPFTAWPTARDGEPESLWTRTRARLARIFRRGETEGDTNHHGENGARENGAGMNGAMESVSPPDDFEFPWSRPDESRAATEPPSLPATHDSSWLDEAPNPEPFGTVDEALPVADATPAGASLGSRGPFQSGAEADTDPLIEAAPPVDTQEVRPAGFFARLFKRETTEETTAPVVLETTDEVDPNFLVSKFRAFYNEVLSHKHQGTAMTAGFATAILTHEEPVGESPEQAAQALSARLQQMLELQQAQATWMRGETAARFQDAQYAMAVLADETLASADWKGSSAWAQYSLEQKLFKSHAADLEFFRRVDRLFKEGPPTTISRDLARVYLLVIASGFRGKYGTFGLTRALHEYRQRLFEYIHGGDALLLYADDRTIFPDAVAHTIVGKATRRVSSAQRWVGVLILVLVGYTVLAHLAWNRASAELQDVTARVEATNAVRPRTR